MKTLHWLSILICFSFKVYAQTSVYPGAASPNWKAPVANAGSLPATGNSVGDLRIETTTFSIYTWNGAAWLLQSTAGAAPGTVTNVTGTAPIVITGVSTITPNVTCNVASGAQAGCLSSADWTTFNSKQAALTFGSISDAGTDGITVTNGANSTVGPNVSLAQHVADATHNGYLSSADWSTFNGKENQINFTQGSVPFAAVGGDLTQDNTQFFWDDVAHALKLRNSTYQFGTADAFARSQIWNYDANSVLRLGSWQADGDPTSVSSQGMVTYGDSLLAAPIDATHGSYARIKNNRFGLFDIDAALPFYAGGAYYYRVDDTQQFYLDNNGSTMFSVQRANGNTIVAGSLTEASLFDSSFLDFTEIATPATPAASHVRLYSKAGDGLYYLDSSAVEHQLSAVGASVTNVTATLPLHSSGGTTPNITIDQAATGASGYLSAADWNTFNNAATQVNYGPSVVLYVDQNSPSAATRDGTILRPFVHIMDAVNQIIANNNGLNYVIKVAPGTYSETISLNNAAISRLAIVAESSVDGQMSNDAIPITSLVGDINSTANNDNLKALVVRGFDMQGNIIMTGASNGTNFCQYGCVFSDMIVYSQAAPAIGLTNAGNIVMRDIGTAIAAGAGGVNITNVNFYGVYSSFLNLGTIAIVTNNGANKPSGFAGTSVQTSFGNRLGTTTVDAGSTLTQRFERVSGTLTSSGTISSVRSSYGSAITLNAGAMTSLGDVFSSYPVTAGGTFTPSDFLEANSVTITSLSASQPVKTDANKNLVSGSISLTTDVSGVLPVANGGTNSSTALNNNRVMQSSGGAIVEAAAITANRALISDANGIPTQSATTATEIGYVSGVTSAIQTQLNGKQPVITIKTKTANYTAVAGDVILADASGGPFTITIPASGSSTTHDEIKVEKIDSSANVVSVTRTGADLIQGLATQSLDTQYDALDLHPDGGTNWYTF